jgi:hypothetical protein
MPRTPKTPGRQDLLETKISEFTALIKELSPQARVEISFESNNLRAAKQIGLTLSPEFLSRANQVIK